MAKKTDAGLFERLIVILFGIGVVLAGLYPLTREYGGFSKFIKEKSSNLEGYYSNFESSLSRARLSEKSDQRQGRTKSLKVEESRKPEHAIDNNDRKELDSLLNKIGQ